MSLKSVSDLERRAAERGAEAAAASKTQTSARPTPAVSELRVTRAASRRRSTESVRCCPRCAVVMNARLPPGRRTRCRAARRRRAGCASTRGGVDAMSTMLTRCRRGGSRPRPRPSLRAATATGSRPTGTEPVCVSRPAPTVNDSSRLSGVLTANEGGAVRGQRQRPDLARLEVDERGSVPARRRRRDQQECQQTDDDRSPNGDGARELGHGNPLEVPRRFTWLRSRESRENGGTRGPAWDVLPRGASSNVGWESSRVSGTR